MPSTTPLVAAEGPLLVFGGPYGNLQATRALLDEAAALGVPAERIVCTGDVVAYCGDPQATVDLVRRAGIHVVMGNCEESLAASAADCGCGFAPGSSCEALSAAWFAHADRVLDGEARAWMGGLPRRIDLAIGGLRLAVVHGGAASINRFLFASTPSRIKAAEIASTGAEGIVAGHCGLPFTEIVEGMLWHNAGAVGMPANDGTPRVWFSLMTPDSDGLRVEYRALGYDHEAAARRMRGVGLPEGYAAALSSGLWPSCDVLPERELAARGAALDPGALVWPARAPETAGPELEIARRQG